MNIELLLSNLFFFFLKVFFMWLFWFGSKFYVTSSFNKRIRPTLIQKIMSFLVVAATAILVGAIGDHKLGEHGVEMLLILVIPGWIGLTMGYGEVANEENKEFIKKVYDKMDKERNLNS